MYMKFFCTSCLCCFNNRFYKLGCQKIHFQLHTATKQACNLKFGVDTTLPSLSNKQGCQTHTDAQKKQAQLCKILSVSMLACLCQNIKETGRAEDIQLIKSKSQKDRQIEWGQLGPHQEEKQMRPRVSVSCSLSEPRYRHSMAAHPGENPEKGF